MWTLLISVSSQIERLVAQVRSIMSRTPIGPAEHLAEEWREMSRKLGKTS